MLQNSNNNSMSHVFLSDDLIIEVLSFLRVKSLMRFKCVTKFWNTLISDPTFVKLHLQRSPKTLHIAKTFFMGKGFIVVTVPVNRLIENRSITIPRNPNRLKINDCNNLHIIGSCNGLLCLRGYSLKDQNIWFQIWNPATNTISKRLGHRTWKPNRLLRHTFGYDNSTTTYKVVEFSPTEVEILNLGDNSWRTISSFPPYEHVVILNNHQNEGVYLSGTVNWFAIRSNVSYDYWLACRNDITVDQFVIISLDLGTETYMLLSPPHGIDEVPCFEPIITVLMDCLCFSHNFKGTHFVIWKMTEFGVEQSWTQFLKISFQNLQVDIRFINDELRLYQLFPFCLSRNGHTLILFVRPDLLPAAIFYNLRDNRVEQTSYVDIAWFVAKNYVESLASIC